MKFLTEFIRLIWADGDTRLVSATLMAFLKSSAASLNLLKVFMVSKLTDLGLLWPIL